MPIQSNLNSVLVSSQVGSHAMSNQSESESILRSSQIESEQSDTGFDEALSIDIISVLEKDNDNTYLGFSTVSNKRYVLWNSTQHLQWITMWAAKLQGKPNLSQFLDIKWGKSRDSKTWDDFSQAMDIQDGLPKAICRTCWKAYSHPDIRNGGSSTGTLKRHLAICPGSKQHKITMRKDLEDILEDRQWSSEGTKIPCMAHVVQLVVKAMLAAFDIQLDENIEQDEDIERDEEPAIPIESNDGTVASAIKKICTLSTIISRSGIKTDLLLTKQSEIEQKRLLRPKIDFDIRWNSTYDMILRAKRLRYSLKSWLEEQMEKEPTLDRLILTNTDWKKLDYLIFLLHPFALVTTGSNTVIWPGFAVEMITGTLKTYHAY
ncbi:hypothetical protein B7463_g11361, partial [Scytalidium lignicola]